ncbi:Zinc finger RING-type [Trinorchestia longiramus]|nr:Zinc finger RING-type [Trinorchestia longiramus]
MNNADEDYWNITNRLDQLTQLRTKRRCSGEYHVPSAIWLMNGVMWCCGPSATMRSSADFGQQRAGVSESQNYLINNSDTPSSSAVMASTLVETVSINYEDFSEYFLTCGTCLCSYDGAEHTPKLLPCSHTVCLHCLSRIVASPSPRDDGAFRCPICRENIRIPSGGVAALPPSFLVNQLLDLMSTQRREVIPKCSMHSTQELLFCESCDLVFCLMCNSGSHHSSGSSASTSSAPQHHTVVPLAVAVKRMSEILCYKANECYAKLNSAGEAVTAELHALDHSVESAFDEVNRCFEALLQLVEQRRMEVVAAVEAIRDTKRNVLEEQLELIEAERTRVRSECEGLQYQVEVRNITKRIAHLNTKIDTLSGLAEPRENAFLKFEACPRATHSSLCSAVQQYGRVATSRTLPSLCVLTVPPGGCKPVSHLRTHAVLRTVDYQGHSQVSGGDPVEAEVTCEGRSLPCDVTDNTDGSYHITFTPTTVGTYCVSATIFGRPVKNSPVRVEVGGDHNPHTVYGSKGAGSNQLLQPAALCVDEQPSDGGKQPTVTVFVADTGNSRIKVLDGELCEQHHLVGEALSGRGVTGLTLSPASASPALSGARSASSSASPASSRTLLLVNWRLKTITELTQLGEIVQQFTHDVLKEPTAITVTPSGAILVVDGSRVLVFSPTGGTLLKCWGERGNTDGKLGDLSAICAVHSPGGAAAGETASMAAVAGAAAIMHLTKCPTTPTEDLDSCSGGGGGGGGDDACEVVVADHRLQVFSAHGTYIRTIFSPSGGGKAARGSYGGLCLDSNGLLLASRHDRSHSCVQLLLNLALLNFKDFIEVFIIDICCLNTKREQMSHPCWI